MKEKLVTTSSAQTKKLGELLASEICGGPPRLPRRLACRREAGEIICLSGDLGAGKTTFTQGLLKGLKIKGPYTSPTFAIVKEYKIKKLETASYHLEAVYHIDAYRINSKDLLELGFKDFAGKKNTITIIEWPEKVRKIIPTNALWINFEWLSNKERRITLAIKQNCQA